VNNKIILVVDDNPINLKLVHEVLEFACGQAELAGCRIIYAADAEQALEIIRRLPLDLILLDIALPGMDGLALTRQLKADMKTKDIPIVALTASAMKGDEKKARDAGFDGYVTKPFDTRSLATLLRSFLAPEENITPDAEDGGGPSNEMPMTTFAPTL
jgi:two-component system, cell cycle response regulator DivK